MQKDFFSTRKTYHLVPDKGDWKIVEEVTAFVPVTSGTNKAALLKEAVKLARDKQPARIVIYKSDGGFQEDRLYGGNDFFESASSQDITANLKKLIKNLYYPSESDYPFEIYTLPATESLSAGLYKIAEKSVDTVLENVSFPDFFARLIPQDWMDEEQKKNAARFLRLQQYLKVTLTDLSVTRIGKIDIAVLITGKTKDGGYLVLKSTAIET